MKFSLSYEEDNMTKYEMYKAKIDLLRKTAKKSRGTMKKIWEQKAAQLQHKMENTPIKELEVTV
jgi:hypothetical protein